MKKSARKMLAGLSIPLLLLLLLLAGAPRALPQQAAPKTASPTAQPQVVAPVDAHARVTETAIDATTPDDPAVSKMLAVYSPKVKELEVVLGKLKGELKKAAPARALWETLSPTECARRQV